MEGVVHHRGSLLHLGERRWHSGNLKEKRHSFLFEICQQADHVLFCEPARRLLSPHFQVDFQPLHWPFHSIVTQIKSFQVPWTCWVFIFCLTLLDKLLILSLSVVNFRTPNWRRKEAANPVATLCGRVSSSTRRISWTSASREGKGIQISH